MKIYHTVIAKTEKGISGGEVCMIALVKYLAKKKYKNVIITTSIGKEAYENSGLREDRQYVTYHTIGFSERDMKHHMFVRWILALRKVLKSITSIKFSNKDIMMCHTDFFPDYITAWFCKKKNNNLKIFYWYHMAAPSLLYGYEGEVTKKIQFPKINVLFYQCNQLVFRLFITKDGVIITVNKYCEAILKKIFHNNQVYRLRHFGGSQNTETKKSKKIYDVLWIGRFHPQKGVFQFIDIFYKISRRLQNVNAVVIGEGEVSIKERFFAEIKEKDLERNINYIGSVVNNKKYLHYLRSSKIFLMTSTYEGFGLVNLDAMRQGLPVVAYDLPMFGPIKKGITVVPILRNHLFAHQVVKLLEDKKYYKEQAQKSYEQSLKFSWDKMGKELVDLIFP